MRRADGSAPTAARAASMISRPDPRQKTTTVNPLRAIGRPPRAAETRGRASGTIEVRRRDEDGRTLRRSCCFECGNGVARAPSRRLSGGFPSQVSRSAMLSANHNSAFFRADLPSVLPAAHFHRTRSIYVLERLFSYFTDASRTIRHTIFGVFPAFSPTFLALAFQWLALPPTNPIGAQPSSGHKPCTLVTIGFAPFSNPVFRQLVVPVRVREVHRALTLTVLRVQGHPARTAPRLGDALAVVLRGDSEDGVAVVVPDVGIDGAGCEHVLHLAVSVVAHARAGWTPRPSSDRRRPAAARGRAMMRATRRRAAVAGDGLSSPVAPGSAEERAWKREGRASPPAGAPLAVRGGVAVLPVPPPPPPGPSPCEPSSLRARQRSFFSSSRARGASSQLCRRRVGVFRPRRGEHRGFSSGALTLARSSSSARRRCLRPRRPPSPRSSPPSRLICNS